MSDFLLFWGGPYSQWYKAEIEINGITYNCNEQYMMAEKARLFKDEASLDKIMSLSDPREQKKIGRQVEGFSKELWERPHEAGKPFCWNVVWDANYAKFTQNAGLWEELDSTGDVILVEASPYDKVWGIGLGEDDPRALDESQWQGTNWLGEVITDVGTEIRREA